MLIFAYATQKGGIVSAVTLLDDGNALQFSEEASVELAADSVLPTELHDFKQSVAEVSLIKNEGS